MATYVLVHGAWGGGWKYARVAQALRARGHVVFTPTLTGQGERAHLSNAAINLTTHVTDILNVIHCEDLSDIVLAGHSYGGMVITAVADEIPDKIAALVYLDAFVPDDGKSLFDLNIPQNTQMFIDRAGALGGLFVPPPPARLFRRQREGRGARRCTRSAASDRDHDGEDQAFRRLSRGEKARLCAWHRLPRESPFKPFYEAARAEGWEAHALPCGHDVMLDLPDELTEILDGAAR